MLKFLKRQSLTPADNSDDNAPVSRGWFKRLTNGLGRTRQHLGDSLGRLILGAKSIDDALLEEIETQLIMADVGVDTSEYIIAELTQRLKRRELNDANAVLAALQEVLLTILQPCTQPLEITASHRPYVILMVGVNGNGKTTTIGKLAKRLQQQKHSVLLAAGDTFRAAAVEQLQVWGERNHIPVIAQGQGADSASVIYDAIQAAKARNIDVVIADTAGRLHTQTNLMAEIQKVKRVIQKFDATAPHEIMLVLDAGTGQNALQQAQQFNNALGLTGVTLTKLDGTAKGGMIFNIAKQLHIPIHFIGVGEGIDDLQPFVADAFVDALFSSNELE